MQDNIKKLKKIAIIGGSFNPVTNGHMEMAKEILRKLPDIQQIWLMPAYKHPFLKHAHYTSDRISMIHMVETEQIKYFGYEVDNKLSGVTYDTFSHLLNDPQYEKFDFYMVIGSDCVWDFDQKWKNSEKLARLVKFIVMARPGYSLENYKGLLSKPPHILLQDVNTPDISATQVREKIRRHQSIKGLVPPKVEKFITSKLIV